jgi:hypothetical protein
MFDCENSHQALSTALYARHRHLTRIISLSPQSLRVVQTKMSGLSLVSLADCHQFVVQFPEFVRILQARWLLQSYLFKPFSHPAHFYDVQHLLCLSWDDIMAFLSALRLTVGGGTRSQVIAGAITLLALSLELYPTDVPLVASELAVGLLHLIQRIGARGLPITFW